MAPERDAVAVDSRLNQLIVMTEVQLAGGLEIAEAERVKPELPVEPRSSRVLEIEQDVLVQVVRRSELLRELRAANGKHGFAEQEPAAGDAVLGYVAHGDVDVRSVEVFDDVVGRRNSHVDVRMIAREAREMRNQPQRGEARRRRDDDGVHRRRAAQAPGAVVQFLQRVLRGPIEQLTVLGEQQRPRAPLEQLDAEVLLELLDLPAHGRLRQESPVAAFVNDRFRAAASNASSGSSGGTS